MGKRIKVSYLRRVPNRKRRIRVTYYKYPQKALRQYNTQEQDISKTGLRKYLAQRKKVFKRLKGKRQVNVKLKVVDSSGKINKDLKGIKGLILPRQRKYWQKAIGEYIHNQLMEYNLYIGNYFSPKVARKIRVSKARSVKVSLEFKKI